MEKITLGTRSCKIVKTYPSEYPETSVIPNGESKILTTSINGIGTTPKVVATIPLMINKSEKRKTDTPILIFTIFLSEFQIN
jgi:hypothetical protein